MSLYTLLAIYSSSGLTPSLHVLYCTFCQFSTHFFPFMDSPFIYFILFIPFYFFSLRSVTYLYRMCACARVRSVASNCAISSDSVGGRFSHSGWGGIRVSRVCLYFFIIFLLQTYSQSYFLPIPVASCRRWLERSKSRFGVRQRKQWIKTNMKWMHNLLNYTWSSLGVWDWRWLLCGNVHWKNWKKKFTAWNICSFV